MDKSHAWNLTCTKSIEKRLEATTVDTESHWSDYLIRIWTKGQNLVEKSKFLELSQNEQERSPRRYEPNALRMGSNGHWMSEISRFVRFAKQAKKDVDCTFRTVRT